MQCSFLSFCTCRFVTLVVIDAGASEGEMGGCVKRWLLYHDRDCSLVLCGQNTVRFHTITSDLVELRSGGPHRQSITQSYL